MRQASPGPASAGTLGSASRLQQIVDAQRAIAVADLDLESVMSLICERTQSLTNADAAAVLVPEGRIFRYAAATATSATRSAAS